MIRAHKIRIYPNNRQQTLLRSNCSASRIAYNWALETWQAMYECGEKPTVYKLDKLFNAIKGSMYPWMKKVSSHAHHDTICHNVASAWERYFKKLGGRPKFKSKRNGGSYIIVPSGTDFGVVENKVKIPKVGLVRMACPLRFVGRITQGTISQIADKWYVCIAVEVADVEPVHKIDESQNAIGVDLGVKKLAMLSDGTIYDGESYKDYKRKLRRLNKELARRKGSKKGEKKSKRFLKTKRKLARFHASTRNKRIKHLHDLTNHLTRTSFNTIGIENLNVSGMMKNHKLAGAIAFKGFYEFKTQLEYKAKETGCVVIEIDRFYPSSKTCSNCGHVKQDLKLKDRIYICPNCGFVLDRDLNAAINIRNNAVNRLQTIGKEELNVKPKITLRTNRRSKQQFEKVAA